MSIIAATNQIPPHRTRMSRFILTYAGIFLALAACGGYLVERKAALHDRGALFAATGFATDMTYLDLPRMTVSMSDGQGGGGPSAPRMRMDISLEVASKDIAVLQGFQPRMLDRMNGFLGALSPEQLKDPAALAWMRQQLLTQVNSVGSPVPVHDVMFREFVLM